MTIDKVEPSPTASARRSESASQGDGSRRTASPSALPAKEEGARSESSEGAASDDNPPLPNEPVPDAAIDGWEARPDPSTGVYYFYNSWTGVSQWHNPRLPALATSYASYDRTHSAAALPSNAGAPGASSPPKRRWGGYNPAIHGSYDPKADYAKEAMEEEEEEEEAAAANVTGFPRSMANNGYTAQAQFNRFTGKFQTAAQGPEVHNDENKSKRQMTAFFDVDAAANSHDGRSLKAERRSKTLTKKELKAYKEKRREKKEEKRRAWLRD